MQAEFFWVVMPCSVVVGYQRFGGPCCLRLKPEGSVDLRNVGILPQHYTAYTSPWRWRQYGPPKRWYPTTKLDGVTTQKTSTCNLHFR